MEKFDIFVSYRRDGGEGVAGRISDKFSLKGYKVFFDVESLRSGKFNDQIFDAINMCSDMIVVLPPNGLDRCQDDDDWVRLEIAYAIMKKKNIIPVLLRNFDFPKNLPDDIASLAHMQGVTATSEYFDATISRIENLLLCKKEKETVFQSSINTNEKIKIPFLLRTPIIRSHEWSFLSEITYTYISTGHFIWNALQSDELLDERSIAEYIKENQAVFYKFPELRTVEDFLNTRKIIKKLDEIYLVPKRYRDDSINPHELMYEIAELAQTCFYNADVTDYEFFVGELMLIGYELIGNYSRLKGFPFRLVPSFCFKCYVNERWFYDGMDYNKALKRVSSLIQDSTGEYALFEDAALILNNRVKLFLKYFRFISMFLCTYHFGDDIKKYLLMNYKYLKKNNVVLTQANEELFEEVINIFGGLNYFI